MRRCFPGPWWVAGATLALTTGGSPVLFAQTLPTEDQCVTCHLTLDDERLRIPAEIFPDDVHGVLGFDCLSCHGRSKEGAGGLDPNAGFLARPERREISALCGGCHSDAAFMRGYNPSLRVDQEAEYATSGHGRALLASDDPDVATCVSCHPAHRTLPPDNPDSSVYPLNVADLCGGCHADSGMMDPRDRGTGQLEDYRTSVHGRMMFEDQDLSAPTCNDCHGNHGAAPPGLASVRNVCGQCHTMMADFFASSGHIEIFDDDGLPGCATCHDHHAIEATDDDLLVERSESVCASCHEPADPDGNTFRAMKSLIDSLEAESARSRGVLLEAENLGMEVEQALFDLDEVGNALVKARTAIHGFQLDPVRQEIDAGLVTTAAVLRRGEGALFEHWYRRAGLALSAGIILILIFGLILKIRQVDLSAHEFADRFETFFSVAIYGGRETDGHVPPGGGRLAACALLIEFAYGDDDFTPPDRVRVEELIQRRAGLTAAQAEQLIGLVRMEREAPGGPHEFTSRVARHFSAEEKQALLDSIRSLVVADEGLAHKERRLMRKIRELLEHEPHPAGGDR